MTGNIYYDYLRIAIQKIHITGEHILITANTIKEIDQNYFARTRGALDTLLQEATGLHKFIKDVRFHEKTITFMNGGRITFGVSVGFHMDCFYGYAFQTIMFPNLYYMSPDNIGRILTRLRVGFSKVNHLSIFYNEVDTPEAFKRAAGFNNIKVINMRKGEY